MYYNGQTLRHKVTNTIVRLAVEDDSSWAWNLGNQTHLIDENGKSFADNSDNYTAILNHWGEPQGGVFNKKLPDLSLKKYLASEDELRKMREKDMKIVKRLRLQVEQEVLQALSGLEVKTTCVSNYLEHLKKVTVHFCFILRKNKIPDKAGANFMQWFLNRREAKVLYTRLNWDNTWFPCAYKFEYAGKIWIWHYMSNSDLHPSSI